jgi:hypothetical protein
MAERDKQEWITGAFVGIGLAGMGLFGALAAASATLGPVAVPIWAMAVGIVAVTVRSPVAKAFAKRLSNPPEADPSLPDQIYGELDELRARVLELEERQDFSERVLTSRTRETDLA